MSKTAIWPNFFIVGAAKAGTTSLYAWLRQHPQVYMSPVKEPHYFSRDLVKNVRFVIHEEEDYLKLFRNAGSFRVIGEASASYLPFGRIVAERIKATAPHARIVIILRDPVERCFANYLMRVRNGQESMTFYEALVNSPLSKVYVQTYAQPVREYLDTFGKQKVLVLMFEHLKNNPRALLKQVAQFLDVDEGPMMEVKLSVENPGGVPRGRISRAVLALRRRIPVPLLPLPKTLKSSLRRMLLAPKPPMDPRAVEYLRPIFEADLRELERVLGRPLPELRKVW